MINGFFLLIDWAYGYYRQQRKLVEEIGWSYTGKHHCIMRFSRKFYWFSIFICKRKLRNSVHLLTQLHGYSFRFISKKHVICKMISSDLSISRFVIVEILVSDTAGCES